MSDSSSPQGKFEPVHSAHAIEQVIFTLQFEPPLEEALLLEACRVAEQFNQELPKKAPVMGFSFVIGPGVPNPIPTGSNNGTFFQKTEIDGTITHELRVERSSLTFRTTLYSRWGAIWQQANKYFNALAPLYSEQTRLSAVSVNYVDKFVWSGNAATCRPSFLLRAGSKYICPHVYEAEDFWHSHTGAFIRIDNQTRRLLNANVDYLDETVVSGTRRIVAITTVLTDQLNQPGYEPCTIGRDGIANFVDGHMQGLHVFGKKVFSNIINEEMCKRIALIK